MIAQPYRISLTIMLILILALSACNLPSQTAGTTPDKNVLATQVAQTVQAALPKPTNTPTPSPTGPPVTSTPTLSPTPAFPAIWADVNTNCRSGPDIAYPILSLLQVGQKSTVHGRNDSTTWWYIENPASAGAYCWVYGKITHVEGDASQMPVIAAPPVPTAVPGSELTSVPGTDSTPVAGAGIVVSYSNIHSCNGNPNVIFQVINNGDFRIRSVDLTVSDLDTGDAVFEPAVLNLPFMASPNDCPPGGNAGNALVPGLTGYIGVPVGTHITTSSGHLGQAFISLCSDRNLGGDCFDDWVQFTYP